MRGNNLEEKLQAIGYALPDAPPPAASYAPFSISGNLLFISGQLPLLNGKHGHLGRVGHSLTMEQGAEAARACALNILAQAHVAVTGDWLRISRCIKLGGFVNCTPEFTDHAKVINGASNLIMDVMGEAGRHARFAVGASSLPLGVAVEIEAIFEIKL